MSDDTRRPNLNGDEFPLGGAEAGNSYIDLQSMPLRFPYSSGPWPWPRPVPHEPERTDTNAELIKKLIKDNEQARFLRPETPSQYLPLLGLKVYPNKGYVCFVTEHGSAWVPTGHIEDVYGDENRLHVVRSGERPDLRYKRPEGHTYSGEADGESQNLADHLMGPLVGDHGR